MYIGVDAAFMPNRAIILAGDLNVDVDKGKDCSQVRTLMKDYNLTDAYREVHESEPGYTWENSRLDNVFVQSVSR